MLKHTQKNTKSNINYEVNTAECVDLNNCQRDFCFSFIIFLCAIYLILNVMLIENAKYAIHKTWTHVHVLCEKFNFASWSHIVQQYVYCPPTRWIRSVPSPICIRICHSRR